MDAKAQVIVATDITQETNDKKQFVPMVKQMEKNLGKLPDKLSADAGYFSETNITDKKVADLDLYIPPDRQKHGEAKKKSRGPS